MKKGGENVRNKSEAQILLERVEMLDAMITNKLIERQQWRDIALGITANMEGERVQSTGAKSKMANAVERCVDMEAEIDSLVDKFVDTKKEVIQTIEQLYSPTEYKLLHLRYIQFVPLVDIADMWGVEYTNITTTHGRALKNVQDIMHQKHKTECL
jgi:hypothetical protein